MITIEYKLFFKLRLSLDGLVTKKKVFSESSHHIDTYLDVVVGFLEVQRSVASEFYIDKDFIEFW